MRWGQRRADCAGESASAHLGNKGDGTGLLSVVFLTLLTKKLHVRSYF
jgi:hypothetical protein